MRKGLNLAVGAIFISLFSQSLLANTTCAQIPGQKLEATCDRGTDVSNGNRPLNSALCIYSAVDAQNQRHVLIVSGTYNTAAPNGGADVNIKMEDGTLDDRDRDVSVTTGFDHSITATATTSRWTAGENTQYRSVFQLNSSRTEFVESELDRDNGFSLNLAWHTDSVTTFQCH